MTLTTHDEILRSTVRLARLSFDAAAASVCLYDHVTQSLVFEASSGPDEDRLIGAAVPSDTGIVGWVANTGEPLVVRGVAEDRRFNRDFAEQTGLVPDTIMAAPVEHDGEVLGVLEVLDPAFESIGEISAIDLLTELANQSCAALALLLADREARAARDARAEVADRFGALLDHVGPEKAAAVDGLLDALVKLLA
jgi:signal transduction protein with GAF and PtsI domain